MLIFLTYPVYRLIAITSQAHENDSRISVFLPLGLVRRLIKGENFSD